MICGMCWPLLHIVSICKSFVYALCIIEIESIVLAAIIARFHSTGQLWRPAFEPSPHPHFPWPLAIAGQLDIAIPADRRAGGRARDLDRALPVDGGQRQLLIGQVRR